MWNPFFRGVCVGLYSEALTIPVSADLYRHSGSEKICEKHEGYKGERGVGRGEEE